jgi:hypothetical protein
LLMHQSSQCYFTNLNNTTSLLYQDKVFLLNNIKFVFFNQTPCIVHKL